MKSQIAEQVKSHFEDYPIFCQMIDVRVQQGIEKYGQTLDDNKKPPHAKVAHLLQELHDAMSYTEWLNTTCPDPADSQEALVLVTRYVLERFPGITLDELLHKESYHEA